MGSVIEYHCEACRFSTGELRLGWGKAGRATLWTGLAHCEPCKDIGIADLNLRRTTGGDPRCPRCNGLFKLIEGTSVTVPCPRCQGSLRHETIGTWS